MIPWWKDGWVVYCWENFAFISPKVWLCGLLNWRIKRYKWALIWWTQSSLLVHEQKMNRNSATDVQALKASTFAQFSNSRGRGRGRGMGGRGNRDGSRQYHNYKTDESHLNYRGHNQQPNKSKIDFYMCHKFGHYKYECYTKLPHDKANMEKSNFAAEKNE